MNPSDSLSRGHMDLLAHMETCSNDANDANFSVENGLITTWNRGAECLYGYTAQEAIGQRFIPLLWPLAVVEELSHLYERLSPGENIISIEADHLRKDGVTIPVRLTLSLCMDAAGASPGATITARGMAEEDELQEPEDEMIEIQALVRHAAWLKDGLDSLNHQLEMLEVIDSNTGLINRRTLDMNLEKECQRAARYCTPLSCLLVSIDNFRQYPETDAVLTGKAILRHVAHLLKEEARTTDQVARYEEELLCLVLPHTDREGAVVAAERIRERVAVVYGLARPVTVSVGVATFSHAMESGRELVAEAEKALSVAKQEGCNRVVHYEATQDFALFRTGRATARVSDSGSRGGARQAVTRVGDASSLNISRKELAHAYDSTIEGWARVLDLRHKETEGHSRRVMEMTVCLAQLLGIRGQDLVYMRWGALLHDIGKIAVPDSILLKPAALTPEEWDVMHTHTTLAYEVLGSISFLQPALDIPLSHHERWDGSGYPQGLRGEEIPLAARIFAPVDVWDALRSDRPYRKAWKERDALDYIYSLSGKHFDAEVMRAFHQMMLANGIVNADDPVALSI